MRRIQRTASTQTAVVLSGRDIDFNKADLAAVAVVAEHELVIQKHTARVGKPPAVKDIRFERPGFQFVITDPDGQWIAGNHSPHFPAGIMKQGNTAVGQAQNVNGGSWVGYISLPGIRPRTAVVRAFRAPQVARQFGAHEHHNSGHH